MKKTWKSFAIGALAVLALTACQQRQFTIEGAITGATDSTLYLENMTLTGLETLDSVKLGEDGNFTFRQEAPSAPEFYLLRIGNQIINLSIDSTETVTVKAQLKGMSSNYTVEGSPNCEKIRELSLKLQGLMSSVMQLDANRAMNPDQQRDSLMALVKAYKEDVAANYIFQEPQQAYAYFALFQRLGPWPLFDPTAAGLDMRAYSAVATCWDTFYPEALRTKNLHNIALENRKNQRIIDANKESANELPITESTLIDLELTDNQGRIRRLSDLKGQVVLLDFHSFTLKDSPQRILMLRDLYNKYHGQGLEIYQVSIDENEHFWKQQTQQLPWVSVRDEQHYSLRSYNVQQVPEFFTIDRNNSLQKRSMQMDDLEQEIKSLL